MVAAGLLRHRVRVQNPTVLTNDVGQDEYSYSPGDETWARVEFANARKGTDGEVQAAGTALFNVTIRYRDDVTYLTRLAWGTRILQVVGIQSDVLNVTMELECEEADL